MGALPDFDLISWQGRDVVILFDANASTNLNVRRARFALAQELLKRGAIVRIADLPCIPDVNGPDDLLAVCDDWSIASLIEIAGTVAELALAEADAVIAELERDENARERGDLNHVFATLAFV
jgi:hypothetical protein